MAKLLGNKGNKGVGKVIPLGVELFWEKVREYVGNRAQAKIISDRQKVLSDVIKDYCEANGDKDEKGSFYAENPDFIIGKVAKKTVTLDHEKAVALFKVTGRGDLVKTTEVVDDKALERALKSGRVTVEELGVLTSVDVTYAVDVKAKADMPTVDQKTYVAAAKKKPKKGV